MPENFKPLRIVGDGREIKHTCIIVGTKTSMDLSCWFQMDFAWNMFKVADLSPLYMFGNKATDGTYMI